MQIENENLSPAQTARGLKAFLIQGILQGAYARALGLNGPVFTGFALALGVLRQDIAFLTSMAALVSLTQLFAVRFTGRIRRKKLFVIGCAFANMMARFTPILIPVVLAKAFHLPAIYFLSALGFFFVHLRMPILGDWLSRIPPESHRAKFVSQRSLGQTVMVVVAGFLFGAVLDMFPAQPGEGIFQVTSGSQLEAPEQAESDNRTGKPPDAKKNQPSYIGFLIVFLCGGLMGLGICGALATAPMPKLDSSEDQGSMKSFMTVFRNADFRGLIVFRFGVQFCMSLSLPFYAVFMLDNLGISYTRIALYQNIALIVVLLSNRPVGGLVSRFGSKPVLQLALLPGIIAPLFWATARPELLILVPIALIANSLMMVTTNLASIPMLWDKLPEKGRPPHLVAWSLSLHLANAIGAFTGGIIVAHAGAFTVSGMSFDSIQLVFLLTAASRLLLMIPLHQLQEKKSKSLRSMLSSLWRGNTISFLINSLALNLFKSESIRSRAATALGRSGSPMAINDLVDALDDISPDVRRSAATGLGLIGEHEAAPSLMDQMADKESDIRAEAAEALGKIGHPLSLAALQEALDDPDPSVRVSAARSLGEIGGEGIRKMLYERLKEHDDSELFPTLVDSLSRLGETRVVRHAMRGLSEYQSTVIQAQLLNSVCRSLGAGESFYRLAILSDLGQASRIHSEIRTALGHVDMLKGSMPDFAEQVEPFLNSALEQCHLGRYADMFVSLLRLVEIVATIDDEEQIHRKIAIEAAEAVITAVGSSSPNNVEDHELIFATVVSTLSLSHLVKGN